MSGLTIVCCLFRGHVGYTADYVEKLQRGILRNDPELEYQARWVCITDGRCGIPTGWEILQTAPLEVEFAWWNKIRLFDPRLNLGERILYLDLDVLPVSSIMPILYFPAHFALARHAGSFAGKNGKKVVRKYNSSVMIWDHGHAQQIWRRWSPDVPNRLWGDQDWIATVLPNERRLPMSWTPRMISDVTPPWPERAKIVLVKKPKPHMATQQYPWFKEWWK